MAVWAATAAEVSEGWAEGTTVPPSQRKHPIPSMSQACHEVTGFSTREVDTHPWVKGKGQWRALRRFGIFQKNKWRPIDDATEAGFNGMTGSDEKITLIRADSPAPICAAFARSQMQWQERLAASGKWESSHGSAVWDTPDAYEHGKEDARKGLS